MAEKWRFHCGPRQLLDWMLFSAESGDPNLLVAAYDGTKLVGTLPQTVVQYHLHGWPITGSYGSFFTIDPAYENQGILLKMVLEQAAGTASSSAPLTAGYLIRGESVSMGHQFWMRLRDMHVVMRAGLWVRLINHRVMSEFLFHAFEKHGARALGWFQGPPKRVPLSAEIRPYRDSDLADCLRLANELSRSAEFGLVWDLCTLGRQLSHKGFPRTLVAEHHGRVSGFVNYFLQEYLKRREMLRRDRFAFRERAAVRHAKTPGARRTFANGQRGMPFDALPARRRVTCSPAHAFALSRRDSALRLRAAIDGLIMRARQNAANSFAPSARSRS